MEERPTCSSSQATPLPPQRHHQDEISLFLHQVLLRSSSNHPRCSSSAIDADPAFSSSLTAAAASSSAGVGGYFLGNVEANACPSSFAGGGGVSENEGDEYDCESEGLEAFLEEVPAKPNPSRSSSKRSRTAEVHNMSEKRRRSRINEKMRALQSLIPNSNKTDKASMLDEAIEYLKQLQLQVQMLSMRNGLSLHPLCLPGVATPIQLGDLKMGFSEESTSVDINSGAHHHVDRATATLAMPGILHDRAIPSIINSELPFGLDYTSTSIQAHPIQFQLKQPSSSQEVMNQSIGDPPTLGRPPYPLPKSGGLDIGSAAGVSLPFPTESSFRKDSSSLDSLPEGSNPSQEVRVRHECKRQRQNVDEIAKKSLCSSVGSRTCDDFVALVQTWLSKIQVMRSGVPNFCAVALALNDLGYKAMGIRLDSGDLAYLSCESRKFFQSIEEEFGVPGFGKMDITASNDLNEETLNALNKQGHEVDAYGIGTYLVTCYAQAALGCVIKLVEINNHPRIELSEDVSKVSIPCKKRSYRLYGEEGFSLLDIMTGENELLPKGGVRILCQHPFNESKRAYMVTQRVEELLECYWPGLSGKEREELPPLEEVRARCISQLDHMRRLNPTPYKVSVSAKLYDFIHFVWLNEAPPVGELQ